MSEKKKLFLLINRLSHAGGSMDSLSMALHLSDRYQVTIIYGEKEKDEKETSQLLTQLPVRFIKINSLYRSILPFKDVASFRKLSRLIRKEKPDIVHTTGFKTGLLGRLAARAAGVPVIVHTYHGHLFHSYYNRSLSKFIAWAERQLARISTHIIAISPQQAYEINSVYKIAPAHKISTIYIGLDEENYKYEPDVAQRLRRQYNISGSTIIVAVIGRIVPIKNHLFFLRVAEKIWQQHSDVCFFIIGDGDQKVSLQSWLSQHHMLWQEGVKPAGHAPVVFTSWIDDIATALRDIDIVALTSLNEGTPVSLIEAQWFEIPVVATNVGGVRDTMIDGETGFLIDAFDINKFVQKLQALVGDKALRRQMGNQGKVFVKERFSKTKEVEATDQLYRDCLQHKLNNSK